jgi:FG-GAP repeat.
MNQYFLVVLLLFITLSFQFGNAQSDLYPITWSTGSFGRGMTNTGILTYDLNGDGVDEIIMSSVPSSSNGTFGSGYVYALTFLPEFERYEFFKMSTLTSLIFKDMEIHDFNNDGEDELCELRAK